MSNQYYTPQEVVDNNIKNGVNKANLPLGKMILLGIMAGAFITLGGAGSVIAGHSITNAGLQKMAMGTIFPAGLMLVILVGGELFTSNCMIMKGVLDKQVSIGLFIKNLFVVFFSNLAGAMLMNFFFIAGGKLDFNHGGVGAYVIKNAIGKLELTPSQEFTSGILCNILVCTAVLMAYAAKDVVGKVFGVFFPIFVFVISGYEHCVANMFYVPVGIIASKNAEYLELAKETYGITDASLAVINTPEVLSHFFFVTMGNIVGGAILVGATVYYVHKKNWKVFGKEAN